MTHTKKLENDSVQKPTTAHCERHGDTGDRARAQLHAINA